MLCAATLSWFSEGPSTGYSGWVACGVIRAGVVTILPGNHIAVTMVTAAHCSTNALYNTTKVPDDRLPLIPNMCGLSRQVVF